ncbi:cytochrome c [Bacillus sp. D386]|uniref:c-type cytochrome n=1 Tax=Bacillus sp. D386 TaxID=2587155 RepID=UPI0011232493|nr:cytochrome c [Bacillus sp. D386]
MKNYLHFGIAVVIIALVGCTTHSGTEKNETASSTPISIANDGSEAARIYEQKCSNCHGDTLEGRIGPGLVSVGEKLSVQEIEAIINDGAPAMPGDLIAEDDAKKVAEWLSNKQ